MANRIYRTALTKFRPIYSTSARLVPGVKARFSTTLRAESSKKPWTTVRSVFLFGSLAMVLYGAAATYALDHDEFHDAFENYIPFGRSILDKLEDVKYQRGVEIRRQFYKDDEEVAPYIREHTTSASKTSSSVEDPLSPARFFDAQSGQVSTETKEYLPLILLPDTSDAFINEISMCINDLIQSVNASAASAATVGTVCSKVQRLSHDIESKHPKHANLLKMETDDLTELVRRHETVKREYLLMNPNGAISPSLPFEMEYHNRLARKILKLERILISFVNTRSQTEEAIPIFDHGITTITTVEKPLLNSPVPSEIARPTTKPTTIEPTSSKELRPPVDKHAPLFKLAASEDFEKILEIQLQLTLASAALSHNGTIDPYVENIKQVLDSKDNKQGLIEEALEGVSVPPHVDVEKVINKVLED